jgi:TonB family protein
MFAMHVDPRTGIVRSVSIENSTGHAILDRAAIDAFSRWKFKPGGNPVVKIPLTYSTHDKRKIVSLHGSPVVRP